eukprot:402337_1
MSNKLKQLSYHMPNPLFWHSKSENKGYIIFTVWCFDAGYKCLIKYDIQNKKYYQIADYTSLEFYPKACGHAINTNTNEVYVFGGHGNVFGKYNLITNKWNIFSDYLAINLPRNFSYPAWCMVNNQLHANSRGTHIRFNDTINDTINKFEQVYEFTAAKDSFVPANNSKMIFINNTLILFSSDSNASIFTCKIYDNKQKIYWKLCDLQLPEIMSFRNGYKCIVAFDNVVIIFRFDKNGVFRWYLDLGNLKHIQLNKQNYQWIGDKIKLPKKDGIECICPVWGSTYVVLTNENMVHWIYPYSLNRKKLFHIEIHLSHLIPSNICQKYIDPLINAYVHKMEQQYNLPHHVPIGILKVIFAYFF